jgi:uncharacterized protein YceK
MKRLAALVVVAVLSGCASVETLGTPENYAKCATADVVSTAAFLTWSRTATVATTTPYTFFPTPGAAAQTISIHSTAATHASIHELNPLVRALTIHGLGRVAGVLVPAIGLSIAGYYFLKWLNKPAVTATAAGLTCLSAGRNLYLIR